MMRWSQLLLDTVWCRLSDTFSDCASLICTGHIIGPLFWIWIVVEVAVSFGILCQLWWGVSLKSCSQFCKIMSRRAWQFPGRFQLVAAENVATNTWWPWKYHGLGVIAMSVRWHVWSLINLFGLSLLRLLLQKNEQCALAWRISLADELSWQY